MKLGTIIKKYRELNNLSLREFANRTKLSHSYIGVLEKGYDYRTNKQIMPTMETMKILANGMDISLDELLKQVDDDQLIRINHWPKRKTLYNDDEFRIDIVTNNESFEELSNEEQEKIIQCAMDELYELKRNLNKQKKN